MRNRTNKSTLSMAVTLSLGLLAASLGTPALAGPRIDALRDGKVDRPKDLPMTPIRSTPSKPGRVILESGPVPSVVVVSPTLDGTWLGILKSTVVAVQLTASNLIVDTE